MICPQTLHLETYGCGNAYRGELFQPIQNEQFIKPRGGLWASPVGSDYGYRNFCERSQYRLDALATRFETWYEGQTLVINDMEDLADVIWQQRSSRWFPWPDYEAMLHQGIDAIYLTAQGERLTRHPYLSNGNFDTLYGYDCECVLVMRPECIMRG